MRKRFHTMMLYYISSNLSYQLRTAKLKQKTHRKRSFTGMDINHLNMNVGNLNCQSVFSIEPVNKKLNRFSQADFQLYNVHVVT